MDLTPAWSHAHQAVHAEGVRVRGVGGKRDGKSFCFDVCFHTFVLYPNLISQSSKYKKKKKKEGLLRESACNIAMNLTKTIMKTK